MRHSYINEGNNRDQNGSARLYFGDRSHDHFINQRFQDHYPEDAPFQREAWTQRESRSRDGLHFGKGPKGYRRTDARIEDDVNEALTRDCYLDASDIEVSVKDAIVTLTGTVANREMKVLAEDCIELISGVKDIKNEIRLSASL
jgi:osmotically-inducible protein OsmY